MESPEHEIRAYQDVSMAKKVSPEVARYRFADAMIAARKGEN